jgi:hypothetical protein
MQPVAPCKDCQEREPGCHDRCEKYQEFRKTRREFNQKMGELGIYNTYVADRKAKIHDTMEKKKKR